MVGQPAEHDDAKSAQLRLLLAACDAYPEAIFLMEQLDPDDPLSFVYRYVNARASGVAGTRAEAMIGHSIGSVNPPEVTRRRFERYAEVMRTGVPFDSGKFYRERDKLATAGWYSVRAVRLLQRHLGLFVFNVSERHAIDEQMRSQERFLDAILEHVPTMLFVKDAQDLRFVRFNRAGEQLLGYPREALIGKSDFDFFPKSEAEFFTGKDREVLTSGVLLDIAEEPIQTATGERWLHTRKVPVLDESGMPKYLLGISEDITERRVRDAELQQKSEALIRSNRDLEQFAYIASHDLQEPLRKVLAFGDRLRIDLGDSLQGDAADSLARMLGAAGRMQALVEDLLSLSRVSTSQRAFATVDLGAVVREVVSDLETRLTTDGAHIEIGELPVVQGDATQLRQLLQNLIVNGLKFHAPARPARVRVSSRHIAEDKAAMIAARHEILVQDDGIGLDMKYAERIFLPFQRLHSRTDYEGTGMGLAICRKIAERHGGSVSVHSEPGQGATFVLTLCVDPGAHP